MLWRILLGAVSVVAGLVNAAVAATEPGGDASATVAALAVPPSELTVAPPTDYPNVRLLAGYAFSGQVTFDPADRQRVAVGIVVVDTSSRCYVRTSADGGRTWGALVRLPQLAGATGTCYYQYVPAVAHGEDGRLYAAYVYEKSGYFGVAVSSSTDQGRTWSSATSAFGGFGSEDSLSQLRLAAAPDGSRIYLGAFLSRYVGGGYSEHVLLGSSQDRGLNWTPVKEIARSYPDTANVALYGFGLAAGRSGNVLVAYGWEEYASDYQFSLKVARSTDHGASFTYGMADEQLGTYGFARPDIQIGPSGTAHLVYEKGWNPGAAVLYKFSLPPYRTWSAESVRLDDDVPGAQIRSPRLAVGACGSAGVLHATWREDSKVLYTRRVARPGYAWAEPLKVGQLKGGFIEHGVAAAGAKAFSVFSGETAVDPSRWGILGTRAWSGVTCP